MATALADALAAAHQRQITHRDLKPGNVMVADDGRVKVLDFGLSRTADPEGAPGDDATRMQLTEDGHDSSEPGRTCRPSRSRRRPPDSRSDLFSLGIVLYELVTGTRPFSGETSMSLMSSIMKDHPRAIGELRSDVPDGVARIITRCLEKHPRDRIQSAHEILIEFKSERRAWESGGFAGRERPAPTPVPAVRLPRDSDLRIAVLPVESRTAGGDAEALADGLTDDITSGLARFSFLRVVARPHADAAKGHAADARAAALVGARDPIEGTVRTAGGAVRITVRLVDVETGTHLWADTYDRSLAPANVFDLQDDVSNCIVATVGASDGVLVRSMAGAVLERPVEDLTLDELVLRHFAFTQTFRADEHLLLRDGFERALAAQPRHAMGWACLADLDYFERTEALNPLPDPEGRARTATDRALELDPACQNGWRQIAIRHQAERDLHGLRMAAERVVRLNPLSVSVPFVGMLLAVRGRLGSWNVAHPAGDAPEPATRRLVPPAARCRSLSPRRIRGSPDTCQGREHATCPGDVLFDRRGRWATGAVRRCGGRDHRAPAPRPGTCRSRARAGNLASLDLG